MLKKIKSLFGIGYRPLLPRVTLPYNKEVKRQQESWLIMLIVTLLVAGFYSYFYIQEYNYKHEIVQVWAAKKEIKTPHVLEASDLILISLPRKSLPNGAFEKEKKSEVLSQITIQNLVANQIVLPGSFQMDLDPESVSAGFEEAYAFSLDEDWFEGKFPRVKPNDKVDILVSNPKADFTATARVVVGVKVIEIQDEGKKKTIILNLTEDQSKSVLFSRGLRLPMQLMVHSAITKSDKPQETASLDTLLKEPSSLEIVKEKNELTDTQLEKQENITPQNNG